VQLTVDLETAEGIRATEELVKLLDGKLTVYVNGKLLETYHDYLYHDYLGFLRDCDVQLHGYNHVHLPELAPLEQLAEIEKAADVYKHVFGVKPSGWRSPFLDFNRDTLRLLDEVGFRWDSSYEQSPITWLRRLQSPVHLIPINHKWFTADPKGTTLLHCFEISGRVLDELQRLLNSGTRFETHMQVHEASS